MSKKDKDFSKYHARVETYPCGNSFEMAIHAGNSDAECHRERISFSRRLVKKDPSVCESCVYNDFPN